MHQPSYCGFCGGGLEHHTIGPDICADCGRPTYADPKVAAACIITIEGALLLVKRAIEPQIGKWSFPSGYVNRGEEVEAAAIREVAEETHLDARINWLVGVYSRKGHPVVLTVYDATAIGGEMVAGEETTDIGLFPLDSLPDLAFEHDEGVLRDWRAERRRRGLVTL
ncbi:MAG: NUDIX domain-containing protein [Chloroflexi bacterium]|nr:NUDIX domain-containing protein [Chloroflexota bacterium]